MNELQYYTHFKNSYGITIDELERLKTDVRERLQSEYESDVFQRQGSPNGHSPTAFGDIDINWSVIERVEREGYEWPTMPWLPAPYERVGKTAKELNELAFKRRREMGL